MFMLMMMTMMTMTAMTAMTMIMMMMMMMMMMMLMLMLMLVLVLVLVLMTIWLRWPQGGLSHGETACEKARGALHCEVSCLAIPAPANSLLNKEGLQLAEACST